MINRYIVYRNVWSRVRLLMFNGLPIFSLTNNNFIYPPCIKKNINGFKNLCIIFLFAVKMQLSWINLNVVITIKNYLQQGGIKEFLYHLF